MKILFFCLPLFCFQCFILNGQSPSSAFARNQQNNNSLKILALGDSYTYGESICEACRFPNQLRDSLEKRLEKTIHLEVIAKSGWTTSDLKSAINDKKLTRDWNLVTLLIGVNNQYRHLPFEIFEKEFPELMNKSKRLSGGDWNNIMVISIPDYAYTPFRGGGSLISEDIKKYNDFIEQFCMKRGVSFVYITDITQKGLEEPELIASDGLHLSTLANSKFVDVMLPIALKKLQQTTH